MALVDQYTLTQDVTFKQRLRVAMCVAAIAIVGEAPTLTNQDKQRLRERLGVDVLQDIETWVVRFAFACSGLGTLSTLSTDGDISNAVSSVWNDVAGVIN